MTVEIKSAYLAPEGLSEPLLKEIDGVIAVHDRLVLSSKPFVNAHWAQNIWKNPVVLSVDSINDAAKKLKAIQRNWCLYSFALHRRAQLIQEKLNSSKPKPILFPTPLPSQGTGGSWCLLDENTLLASADCSSPFPNGEPSFIEDKNGPPNRAYLKLYEALTLAGKIPGEGEFCIDIGGSPGGWAWVIQKCGAEVLSIDRSPLDEKISNLKGVSFEKRDAFSLLPAEFIKKGQSVDWLFSDVICYPEKLYDWLSIWIDSGICKNFICTIKLKGEPETAIIKKFAAIPNSKVLHLFYNKNELTFFRLDQK
jgi:23S rRNA (cytidine2498-2'-O)-methyltransferase